MGSLFSGPPKPTDPKKTAAAQMAVNRDTAQLGAQYNRINQLGAFGGGVSYDPVTGAQTTTIGDQGQRLAGNFDQAQQKYFQTAMGGPENSTGAFNRAFGMAREYTDPLFADQIAAQENKLRNQGLVPGTKAYDSAMESLRRSQGEQYNRAALGLQGQMFNQSQDQFRTGLAALAPGYQYGAQAFMSPQVSPFAQVGTGQTPNMSALTQNYDNQRLANYNNQQMGAFGLAKTGLGLLTAPMTGGLSLAGMGMNLMQGNPYNYGSSWAPSVRYG